MDINGNTHNNRLTLGSLFSGSGGFELAGIMSGITPVFNSEIEPFAIRVTTKRLPQVKHYGDVSALKGAELPPVDIMPTLGRLIPSWLSRYPDLQEMPLSHRM